MPAVCAHLVPHVPEGLNDFGSREMLTLEDHPPKANDERPPLTNEGIRLGLRPPDMRADLAPGQAAFTEYHRDRRLLAVRSARGHRFHRLQDAPRGTVLRNDGNGIRDPATERDIGYDVRRLVTCNPRFIAEVKLAEPAICRRPHERHYRPVPEPLRVHDYAAAGALNVALLTSMPSEAPPNGRASAAQKM